MSKKKSKDTKVANPNIYAVAVLFKDDVASSSEFSVDAMEASVELFTDCLNSYGHQFLTVDELAQLDHYESLKPPNRLNFCSVFGPDKIASCVPVFVGHYLIADIMLEGSEMAEAAGVIAEFCEWLGTKGYVPDAKAKTAQARALKLASRLEKADSLNRQIWEIGEKCSSQRDEFISANNWKIGRMEKDQIWLLSKDGLEIGPVFLPTEVSQHLEPNWTICSALAKVGTRWHFAEVGNLYPDENRDEYVYSQ